MDSTKKQSVSFIELVKRLKCKSGSKEHCTYPSGLSNNTRTVVVAVVVPVGIVIIILSFFIFKNWRKNKEEAVDDDDPNFNGENTILPDVDYYGSYEPKVNDDSGKNPFENESNLKYPSNVYTNMPKGNLPYTQSSFFSQENGSTSTINARKYVDSFILPYDDQTGSKRSLDEFARGLGTHYSAYAATEGSNHSRNSSLTKTVHPFAKSTDALGRTNLLNELSVEDFNIENRQHRSPTMSDSTDSKTSNIDEKRFEVSNTTTEGEDDEDDHSDSQILAHSSRPVSISTDNLVKSMNDRDSVMENDNRQSYVSARSENLNIPEEQLNQIKLQLESDDDIDDPTLPPEEREKLRRLKSIYNVYFERENSVKHVRKENNELVTLPPLPSLPSSMPLPDVEQQQTEQVDEEPQNLTIDTNFDRNYASSVYPENPLNEYEPYQQQQQQYYPQQQYPQQYQQQYYPPQQQLRPMPYNRPVGIQPPHIPRLPKKKPSLTKLALLPTPRELNLRPFSSLNIYTEFQPKFAYKASSSPKTEVPQGFNPLDQWSAPLGSDPEQHRDITPTAISRNSVTMTNPTLIAKSKLYKPAGSLAVTANQYVKNSPYVPQYQLFESQSPISPTGGVIPPNMSSNSGSLTPNSGSKHDLRQDLRHFMNGNDL